MPFVDINKIKFDDQVVPIDQVRFDRKPHGVTGTWDDEVSAPKEAYKGFVEGVLSTPQTIGTLAKVAGNEKAGKAIEEWSEGEAENYRMPERLQGNVFGKNGNLGLLIDPTWIAHGVGQAVGSMIAPLGVGKAFYSAGKPILKKVLKDPDLVTKVATYVGLGAGGAVGGLMEGAPEYNEKLAATGDKNQALAAGAIMTIGSGVLNSLSFGQMLSKPTKAKLLGHILKSGAFEGATETAEGGISAIAQGKPEEIIDRLVSELNVFLPSMIVGGLGGGAGAVLTHDERHEVLDALEKTSAAKVKTIDELAVNPTEDYVSPDEHSLVSQWVKGMKDLNRADYARHLMDTEGVEAVNAFYADEEKAHKQAKKKDAYRKLTDKLATEEAGEVFDTEQGQVESLAQVLPEAKKAEADILSQVKQEEDADYVKFWETADLDNVSKNDLVRNRGAILASRSDVTPAQLNDLIIKKTAQKLGAAPLQTPPVEPVVAETSPEKPATESPLTDVPLEAKEASGEGVVKKEPYEMTREEFEGILPKPYRVRDDLWRVDFAGESRPFGSLEDAQKNATDKFHKVFVREALDEGKPVPPSVLADYPDLQPKAALPSAETVTPPSEAREAEAVKEPSKQAEPGNKADEKGLIARTQPKERSSVDDGTIYQEYRIRKVNDKEYFDSIAKYRSDSEKRADGRYVLERRTVKTEKGKPNESGSWDVTEIGTSKEDAIRRMIYDTSFKKAESLDATHKEVIGEISKAKAGEEAKIAEEIERLREDEVRHPEYNAHLQEVMPKGKKGKISIQSFDDNGKPAKIETDATIYGDWAINSPEKTWDKKNKYPVTHTQSGLKVADFDTLADAKRAVSALSDAKITIPEDIKSTPKETIGAMKSIVWYAQGVGVIPDYYKSAAIKPEPTVSESPKSEPQTELQSTGEPQKAKAGYVFLKRAGREAQYPFTEWREITKGKHKGKIGVTVRGREFPVERKAVKMWPEGKAETIDEETYLAKSGASRQGIGEPALHKNIPQGKIRKKLIDGQTEKDNALIEKRDDLRKEYQAKVVSGEVRPPSRLEKLLATANGHSDNEAVKAARRILEKRGIDWREQPRASRKEKTASLTSKDVTEALTPLHEKWKNHPDAIVVDSIDKLPKELRDRIEDPDSVQAVFDPKAEKIYYIADKIGSPEEAREVAVHETIKHWGLRKTLGPEFASFMDRVYGYASRSDMATLDKIAKNYGLDLSKAQDRFEAADEYVAHMSGLDVKPPMWNRLVSWVQNWLRKIGLPMGKERANQFIIDAVRASRAYVEEGGFGHETIAEGLRRMVAAWHGSPHTFDKFSKDRIGTGEGAQAYGHGMYFAGNKEVAEFYRDKLKRGAGLTLEQLEQYFEPGKIVNGYSGPDRVVAFHKDVRYPGDWAVTVYGVDRNGERIERHNRTHTTMPSVGEYERVTGKKVGSLYEVELAPDEGEYLLWDKPLSEQSEKVKEKLSETGNDSPTRAMQAALQKLGSIGDRMVFEGAKQEELESFVGKAERAIENESPADLEKAWRDFVGTSEKEVDEWSDDLQSEIWDAADLYESINAGSFFDGMDGRQLYDALKVSAGSDRAASDYLHSLGIRGIKYLDGASRGKGEGDYNYVIFSDEDVNIKARFKRKEAEQGVIDSAIKNSKSISFHYTKANKEQGTRSINPKTISEKNGHAYVEGYDFDRGESRTFRIDRMADITEGDAIPEPSQSTPSNSKKRDIRDTKLGKFGKDVARAIQVRPAKALEKDAPETSAEPLQKYRQTIQDDRQLAAGWMSEYEDAAHPLTREDKKWMDDNFKAAYEKEKAMPNERIQKFVDAWTKIHNGIGDLAKKLGVQEKYRTTEYVVKDGDRSVRVFPTKAEADSFKAGHKKSDTLTVDTRDAIKFRPFTKIERYFPHILTPDAKEALRTQSGEIFDALVKAARTKGFDLTPYLEDLDIKNLVRRNANLEHARQANMPEYVDTPSGRVQVLETDPFKVIPGSIEAAARRLAFVQNWGPNSTESLKLHEEYRNAIANEAGSETAHTWDYLWQDMQGRTRDEFLEGMGSHLQKTFNTGEAIARSLMLSTAQIANIVAGPVPIMVKYGAGRTAKAYAKLASRKILSHFGVRMPELEKTLEEYRRMGGWAHDTQKVTGDTESLSQSLGGMADTFLKKTGMEAANRFLNKVSNFAAHGALIDAIEGLKKPDNHGFKRMWGENHAGLRSFLKRDGEWTDADIDRMIQDGITDNDATRFVQRASTMANVFMERAETRPAFMKNGFWRRVFAYTSFYRMMGAVVSDTMRYAKEGNYRPLITLLLGAAVLGSAEHKIKDYLKGIIQRDDKDSEGLTFAGNLLDALAGSGALAMPGTFINDLSWWAKKGDTPFTMPQVQWWGNLAHGMYNAAMKGVDKGADEGAKIAYYTTIKSVPLFRVIDNMSGGPYTKYLDRRYRHGEPGRRRGSDRGGREGRGVR